MKESAADIQKYLNILQGDVGKKEELNEEQIIDLGISTGGATIGKTYIFDNGLRWAKIIDEKDNQWLIESGLIEYEANSQEYISKRDITKMITHGEMILDEEDEELLDEDTLLESSIDDGYEIFMEKVERYLLVNDGRESNDFDFNWRNAFEKNMTPVEAAEEAIILEG